MVPSGAVGALDALRALAQDRLISVAITQRKPPHALLRAAEAAALDEPLVVLEGTAREAIRRYPKTTNVVAAVALAGLGFDATSITIVADPSLRANAVSLSVEAEVGRFDFAMKNVASANPRTSAVAALSAIAALENPTASIVFR